MSGVVSLQWLFAKKLSVGTMTELSSDVDDGYGKGAVSPFP